jgi:4-hydroxy-tetrahydrodipicolinate reductase
MGRALVRAAGELPALRITGAVASAGSTSIGRDAGALAGIGPLGLEVSSDLPAALAGADVAIDFSQPYATRANIAACRAARKPLLIGTTGFAGEVTESELDAAARDIPLLIAPNTSLGVALLLDLVRRSARALPADFDIEVIEAHHRMKRDAPSGTALALAGAAAEGRGLAAAQALGSSSAVRAGPRHRGGAHRALRGHRGRAAAEPPGERPDHLRPGGAQGGPMAPPPATGPLRHARYCPGRSCTWMIVRRFLPQRSPGIFRGHSTARPVKFARNPMYGLVHARREVFARTLPFCICKWRKGACGERDPVTGFDPATPGSGPGSLVNLLSTEVCLK